MSDSTPGSMARPSTLTRYRRLEAQSAAGLERLVELARVTCRARIAFAAFPSSDGARFERLVGGPSAEAQRLLPLFGYALIQSHAFVHGDARLDPALGADPLVAAPDGVRFFAGAPVTDRGRRVGSLCVFDTEARPADAGWGEALGLLANEIAAQMAQTNELNALRERHHEHLRRIELLEGVLAAATSLAIISTDLEGRVVTWSRGAEAMLGLAPALASGRSLAGFLAEEPGNVAESFQQAQATVIAGSAIEKEWVLRRADGLRFPASIAMSVLRSEEGEISGLVAVVQDLTERKRLERAQDEFLANVSHELRTPLTGIQGALGLVLGGVAGPVEGELIELLRMAEGNAARLSRLVLDLLELSSAARPGMAMRPERCDMGAVVRRAVELNRAFALTLGVELAVESSPILWVDADPARLEQVLSNFITNAVRFSPARERVTVGAAAEAGAVRVWVADRGPGVPAAQREKLFSRFFTTRAPATGKPGNGLGLSIARAIVEAHRGTVGYQPGSERGSVFSFTLPLAPHGGTDDVDSDGAVGR